MVKPTVDIDKAELKEALSLMQDSVQKNVDIISKAGLGQDVVYHIALKRFSELVPNVSKRAGWKEDNTVPRVHAGASLRDCIDGYGGVDEMTSSWEPMGKGEKAAKKDHKFEADYKGGFYIHEIPFEVALIPNKKLVHDANYTNELWLVTYNHMTRTYPAKVVGKLFPAEVTYVPRSGTWPKRFLTLYAEITSSNPVRLCQRKFLTRGYWKIIMDGNSVVTHSAVAKEDFLKVKENVAVMLAHSDAPAVTVHRTHRFLTW